MKIITENNKNIYIISTAHVSKKSVQEVKEAVERIQPDVVCVELDSKRAHALMNPSKQTMDIKEIIKSKKVASFLMNLILTNFQKQIAHDLETEVGGEMKQAIISAKEHDIPVRYIDRDVQITLKRIWNNMNLWKKINLAATLFANLSSDDEISESDIERMKESDLLHASISELDDAYPEISQVILHERNTYMAEKIKRMTYENIVVVIGAAHAPGLIENLKENDRANLENLETIPNKKENKWSGLLIPGTLLILITVLTFKSPGLGWYQLKTWILTSSMLASIGAILAGAHLGTIAITFLTTWIGIFSPVLAVGFFSGLTEAYLRPPLDYEFETLSTDIKTIKGWYENRILRIILIFFMTSLMSSIGTFISGKNIIQSLLR